MTSAYHSLVRIFSAFDDQIRGTRENQEDSALRFVHGGVAYAVLADGMGGHAQGEKASKLAVEAFAHCIRKHNSDLKSAVLFAGNQMEQMKLSGQMAKGAGTTFIGVSIRPEKGELSWVSVGDSYLFLFREGRLHLLNFRHTWGNKLDIMAKQGRIAAEVAASDNRRGNLYAALVGSDPADMDCRSYMLRQGDVIILASDGLIGALPLSRLESHLSSLSGYSASEITRSLLEAVRDAHRPSQDNTTVVVISCAPTSDGVPPLLSWGGRKSQMTSCKSLKVLLAGMLGLVLLLVVVMLYLKFGAKFGGSETSPSDIAGLGDVSLGGGGYGSGGSVISDSDSVCKPKKEEPRDRKENKQLILQSFTLSSETPFFSLSKPTLYRVFTTDRELFKLNRDQKQSS